MTRRQSIYDPFDAIEDDAEELEGYSIVDESHPIGYGLSEESVICLYGVGDSEGMCVQQRFGCHHLRCSLSDD